jgi:hypothetical protein
MIEKFATTRGVRTREFLDLNHTSNIMILVSLDGGELRKRDTRAASIGSAEALELGHLAGPK